MAEKKRIVLKVSGAAFNRKVAIDESRKTSEIKEKAYSAYHPEALRYLTGEILSIADNFELAIVVGGQNMVHGSRLAAELGIDEASAHEIGMHCTLANARVLKECLVTSGIPRNLVRVMSYLDSRKMGESFILERTRHHLENGKIIIVGGGTGVPFVSTDSAAVSVARQVKAWKLLKGTNVSGVFDRDPRAEFEKGQEPQLYEHLTWRDFRNKDLAQIFDHSAISQAEDGKLPIVIFDLFRAGNLKQATMGRVGTRIDRSIVES